MNRTEEIVDKLEQLYQDSKSKNFVNHLVKSYCVNSKVSKLVTKPEGRVTCALTNRRLISVSEVLSAAVSATIKTSIEVSVEDLLSGKAEQDNFRKEFKSRVIGFTAEDSSTTLSFEALDALNIFIAKKMLEKDKQISWLVRNQRNETLPRKSELELRGYKKPSTTLGELDSLQKLKQQFEKQGL